jgi:5-methylcytosine-specific restriction endonuclease McrBC GTP-binding regulatory subunit McrB
LQIDDPIKDEYQTKNSVFNFGSSGNGGKNIDQSRPHFDSRSAYLNITGGNPLKLTLPSKSSNEVNWSKVEQTIYDHMTITQAMVADFTAKLNRIIDEFDEVSKAFGRQSMRLDAVETSIRNIENKIRSMDDIEEEIKLNET